MYDSMNWKTFNVVSESALWRMFFPTDESEGSWDIESKFKKQRHLHNIYACIPPILQKPTYFIDPFHLSDTTVTQLLGFYKEKIDWSLSKNLTILKKSIGNQKLTMSDHKYLLVDYAFSNHLHI